MLQEYRKAEQVVIYFAVTDQIELFGRDGKALDQTLGRHLLLHTTTPHIFLNQAHKGHYSKPGEKHKAGVNIPKIQSRQAKEKLIRKKVEIAAFLRV